MNYMDSDYAETFSGAAALRDRPHSNVHSDPVSMVREQRSIHCNRLIPEERSTLTEVKCSYRVFMEKHK